MSDSSNSVHTSILCHMAATSGSSRPKGKKSNKPKRKDAYREPLPLELRQDLRKVYEKKYKPAEGSVSVGKFESDWWERFKKESPPDPKTVRKFFYHEEQPTFEYWLINGLCQLLLSCSFKEWEERHKQPEDAVSEQDQECLLPEASTDREPTLTSIPQMPVAPMPSATATESPSAIAPPDLREDCRVILNAQRQLLVDLVIGSDGLAFDNFDKTFVPLGLLKRQKRAEFSNDVSSELDSEYEITEEFQVMGDGFEEPLVLLRGLSKQQKQERFDNHASLELDSRYKLIRKFQQEKEFFDEVFSKKKSSETSETKELRLAITGTSGTGKTALLLKIGFWILENTEDVPIWISLENVGTKKLKEYLLEEWLSSLELLDAALPERKEQLNQLLKSGRVWLLLDGAEDLTGTSIPLREIVKQLTPWADKAKVVLTCRKSIWNAEHYILDSFNFDVYQTLGYRSDRVNCFIDTWFSEEPELSKQLQDELKRQSRQRIKDLVQNPLHLALLCRIWQDSPKPELPKTRLELYKQFIYEDYKLKKEIFSSEQLIKALGELAQDALNQKKLKHSLVSQKLNEHQLKVALRLGWLKLVDAKNEVYDFLHDSFKEYFAAESIENWDYLLPSEHDNQNPQPVRADYRLFERLWREVILLWLGRDEEELKPKQLSFWESLLSFKDGCNGFYSFQVFLLSSAIVAELGDEELVDYFVERLVNFSFSDFVKPIAEGARLALQEFDYNKLNSALLQLLATISYDENYLEVCSILMQSAPNEATRALAELLENTQNMQNMSLLRIEADGLLRKLDPNHPSLIAGQGDFPVHTLTDEQVFVFESVLSDPTLWETEECDDISTLIELLEVNQNPFLSGFVIKKLEEIISGDPTAINTLCELTYNSNNEDVHEVITSVFRETAFGREDAVKVLIHLLRTSESRNICQEASESLKQILQDGLFKLAVSGLKDCLTDAQSRQINFERYVACYEVVWYCAQHMTYPNFYKAWYPEFSAAIE